VNSEVLEILLVDDNRDDVELALVALRGEGLANHISVVRDGEEALDFLFCRGAFTDRAFDRPPRLVLLDLKLNKVDGMQVLQQVKTDPRTRTIPVVIMTSSKEERDLVAGYNLGRTAIFRNRSTSTNFAKRSRPLGSTGWSSISLRLRKIRCSHKERLVEVAHERNQRRPATGRSTVSSIQLHRSTAGDETQPTPRPAP
jgi:two-component system, response regulator